MPDNERIKKLAADLMDCSEGHTPQEYHAALTLATGILFKSCFPHDLEDAFKGHTENLRVVFEELDKRH